MLHVNCILLLIWTFFICLLISQSDIVGINEPALMLKNIGQCDLKHITTLPIKRKTAVLKVSSFIITSITACPIRLAMYDTRDNFCLNLHNCHYWIFYIYIVLEINICRSLFVLFLLAIVLSVLLRFMDFDYIPLVSLNSSYPCMKDTKSWKKWTSCMPRYFFPEVLYKNWFTSITCPC